MGMEKEKLRQADLITSVIIFLFGLWIVYMAFQMPMKDSFGGVMNVWYVSPALFPLFTGFALMALGMVIFRVAYREVGSEQARAFFGRLLSKKEGRSGLSGKTYRFVAIVILLLFLVYMNIPRIDFFLSSLLFLIVFITMFYFDDTGLLKKLLTFYFIGSMVFWVFFASGLEQVLDARLTFSADYLALVFTILYSGYAWWLVRNNPALKRRYRISMAVALATPLVLCLIFKYFLLVPLPKEGVVVELMDAIRYSIF
jgi:hypothetical protein